MISFHETFVIEIYSVNVSVKTLHRIDFLFCMIGANLPIDDGDKAYTIE